MTKQAFMDNIIALTDTLYRVSYGILGNRDDQADAVQECLRRALQKRETLRDDRLLTTWLVRILINECYTLLRRRQRELPFNEEAEIAEDIADTPPPLADGELYDALMSLPDKYRLPVMLHYIEGYAMKEIAAMLRMPEGTVKTRLRHARGLLKEMLEDEEGCAYEKA